MQTLSFYFCCLSMKKFGLIDRTIMPCFDNLFVFLSYIDKNFVINHITLQQQSSVEFITGLAPEGVKFKLLALLSMFPPP